MVFLHNIFNYIKLIKIAYITTLTEICSQDQRLKNERIETDELFNKPDV